MILFNKYCSRLMVSVGMQKNLLINGWCVMIWYLNWSLPNLKITLDLITWSQLLGKFIRIFWILDTNRATKLIIYRREWNFNLKIKAWTKSIFFKLKLQSISLRHKIFTIQVKSNKKLSKCKKEEKCHLGQQLLRHHSLIFNYEKRKARLINNFPSYSK